MAVATETLSDVSTVCGLCFASTRRGGGGCVLFAICRSVFNFASQAGGLPRRLAIPCSSRSSARMASSMHSRSCRNSVNILTTSIFLCPACVRLRKGETASKCMAATPAAIFPLATCKKDHQPLNDGTLFDHEIVAKAFWTFEIVVYRDLFSGHTSSRWRLFSTCTG
jgi:hypothetical protein